MGVTSSELEVSESHLKSGNPIRNPAVKTIPQCLEYYAKSTPDKEAVVFVSTDGGRQVVTYNDLYEKSRIIAYNLLSMGIRRHEIIGINLAACPEWLYAVYGAVMAGIVPCPIPFTYKDGSDVINEFEKLKFCCMIMDNGYQGQNWIIFSKLIDSFSSGGAVTSTKLPSLRYLLGYKDSIRNVKSFDDILIDGGTRPYLPEIHENDISVLLHSSGSTGIPKILTHTHKSIMAYTDIVFGPALPKDCIFLNVLTFCLAGGFPFSSFVGQTRVALFEYSPPPNDMVTFIFKVIQQERCYMLCSLPPLVHEMLKRKDEIDPTNWPLVSILTGGQPLTTTTLTCLGLLCKYLLFTYGLSECNFISVNVLADPAKFVTNNCGQLIAHREIKIVDPSGRTVRAGHMWRNLA